MLDMATIETEDLEAAFLREYPLLHRVADANLDKKLRARVSPSDVVQDAWVEAVARFGEKEQTTDMPLSAWLKFVVRQSVNRLRRFHLGADKRTVDREQRPRYQGSENESTVSRLVEALSASMAGPASQVVREEAQQRIHSLICSMDPADREILLLRHVENLTNKECAERLNLTTSGASKRYMRALERLNDLAGTTSLC
jgi:RNA polymerase sigma-70 factor (ECF subfamily)